MLPIVRILWFLLFACSKFLIASAFVAAYPYVPIGQTRSALQAKEFASISSDGNVKRPTGSLGKPSNKKKKSSKENKALSKKERQRTGNGTIDSGAGRTTTTIDPSQQALQVVRGNRGNKTVTIVQGMNATSIEDKKKILKTLKSKLGVGGTLVEGVLELQGGTHAEAAVELLKGMGYTKARKIGK